MPKFKLRATLWLLIFILFPVKGFSNFAEYFAATTESAGLAGQRSSVVNDPGHNYYAPALLAFSDKILLSFDSFYLNSQFSEIDNVIIQNPLSDEAENTTESGSMDTDYPAVTMLAINASLPLVSRTGVKLGFSIFAPYVDLVEVNTGDPFQVEYVMHRARYKRTTMMVNMAIPLGKSFAFSVGAYSGLQMNTSFNSKAAFNGSNYGSSGEIKAKARPGLSPIVSLAFSKQNHLASLTYQHSLKNRFESTAEGTTIGPNLPFNLNVSSLLFYDPAIARLAYSKNWSSFSLATTLEYQMWNGYEPPTLKFQRVSGSNILSSLDLDTYSVKNIFIPKIAMKWNTEKLNLSLGVAYRPTPLGHSMNDAGNSVDTDTTIIGSSLSFPFKLFNLNFMGNLGGQVGLLKKKEILKSNNLEDGGAGQKIGSPKYDIGGTTYLLGLGLKVLI